MDLTLSTDDQQRLAKALQVLLSPLDYDDVDAWRSAVNHYAKQLLGADQAAFMLPTRDAPLVYSDEFDPERISSYPDHLKPLVQRFAPWQKQLAQGAWSRTSLWHPHHDAFYRSAYYNDFIVPNRGFDSIGITVQRTQEPTPTSIASLMCHHERPDGPRFGERGRALMRLLLPALQAGVQTYDRCANLRASFFRTLDDTGQCLQLCDLAGRVVHQTPALSQMLAQDPERATLCTAFAKIARNLLRLTTSPNVISALPTVQEIRTHHARYHVQGSYVGGAHLGSESLVLLTLERLTPEWPSVRDLRERFGLTRRQAEAALLLAQGLSNDEVADRMCISPHTARHHTETVLRKLKIHARAEVMQTILS